MLLCIVCVLFIKTVLFILCLHFCCGDNSEQLPEVSIQEENSAEWVKAQGIKCLQQSKTVESFHRELPKIVISPCNVETETEVLNTEIEALRDDPEIVEVIVQIH